MAKSAVESPASKQEPAMIAADDVAATYEDVISLVEWGANPRKNQHVVLRVAKSIKRFGFGAPIVARLANREIIKGHTRFKAAKALGLQRVPVRFLDISEDDAHKLAIADNKLAELAEWDEPALEDMMLEMSIQEAQLLGFEAKELAALTSEDDDASKTKQQLGGLEYKLVIKCADEEAQADLMNRLELEGYEVSPLIS